MAMPRRARRKSLIRLWRLLTVWMCTAPRTPLAGRGVDALVGDVERRRDRRIADGRHRRPLDKPFGNCAFKQTPRKAG